MSAEQRQLLDTISIIITSPGTPQRVTTDPDLYVRAVLIESHDLNVGEIHVTTNLSASMDPDRRHVLYTAGDALEIIPDPYGNLNAEIGLREIWIDGDTLGDRVVISYTTITEKLI